MMSPKVESDSDGDVSINQLDSMPQIRDVYSRRSRLDQSFSHLLESEASPPKPRVESHNPLILSPLTNIDLLQYSYY